MSLEYLNRAFNMEMSDSSMKAVLIGLANHTDPDGHCFPGVARLMKYTALAERTVRSAIKRLEEAGLVIVTRRPQQTSIYRLTILDEVAAAAKTGAEIAVDGAADAPPPAAAAPEPLLNPIIPKVSASNKAEPDARAEIPDDWKPSDATMAYVAEKYPGANIPHQIERFILSNQSRNEKVANPEAAFKKFMTNYPNLKVQAPAESAPSGEAPPVDRQIASILTTIRLYEKMGGRDEEITIMERQLQYLRSKGTEE